jgi:hypothetical protein
VLFKQLVDSAAPKGRKFMAEIDARTELRKSRQALFESRHTNQDSANFLGIEDAYTFSPSHSK